MGKISQMPAAGALSGQELIEVIQGGVNKKLPISNIVSAGKSAYQTAVDNGYTGTEAQWLTSLRGATGAQGPQGPTGANGLSAYQLAVAGGYQGSHDQWLASLIGPQGVQGPAGQNGKSAYQIAVQQGYTGAEAEWLLTLKGNQGINGKSAYDVAVAEGFSGTEAQWLDSLIGPQGPQGIPGVNGTNGKSAYEVAVQNGFSGTQQEWLNSLVGGGGSGSVSDTQAYVLTNGSSNTPLVRGQNVDYIRLAEDVRLVKISASLSSPSISGAVVIDVNVDGVSILDPIKLSLSQGDVSTYNQSADVPILFPNIHKDSKISIDIDDAAYEASGLKVVLIVEPIVLPARTAVPTMTGAAQLTGSTTIGSTLTVTDGTWSNTPYGFNYEWLRDGVVVQWSSINQFTENQYTLSPEDAGKTISVRLTASNGNGSSAVIVSGPVIPIPAPENGSLPTIGGLVMEKQVATVNYGNWNYGGTFTQQWLLDGIPIVGATKSTIALTHDQIFKELSVRVRCTNGTGFTEVTSNAVVIQKLIPGWDYTMPLPTRAGAVNPRTFDVGPDQDYLDISDVPWQTLRAGDLVRIHYRPTPYSSMIYLGARGTEDAWIEIQGIPGVNGERPEITAIDAPPSTGITTMPGVAGAGVVVIGRPINGEAPQPYGWKPGYIWIHGLKIGDARPPYSYKNDSGLSVPYGSFVSAIYANPVEHLTISNCELHSSSLGLFVNSRNAADAQSRNIHIFRNYFTNNGKSGDYSVHNAYTEAIGVIYEYNYFDSLVAGAGGDCIKDRSAGQIIRYNYFKNAGTYTLSLRDPDSNYQYEMVQVDQLYDDLISHSFVYGNMFEMTTSTLVSDGDGEASSHAVHLRYGDICFYSNVVVSRRNYVNVGHDESILFSPYNYSNPLGNTVYRASNNLFYAGAAVIGAGTPAPFALFLRAGVADFHQNKINQYMNISPNPGGYTEGVWAGVPFNGTGLNDLVAAEYDPGFVDYANQNYNLRSDSVFHTLTAPLPTAAKLRNLWPDDFAVMSAPLTSDYTFQPVTQRPVALTMPSITGTAQIGQLLAVNLGNWSNNPTGYTAQWVRDGVAIPGEVSFTYTLVAADGGHVLTCNVYATNSAGTSCRNTDPLVISVDPRAPVNTTGATVSGGTGAGSLLTGDPGAWTSDTAVTYRYQWYTNGIAVSGQTGITYQTLGSQVGQTVTLRVWASNEFGEGVPSTSTPLVLGAAVSAEPDANGLFNFTFPDLTPLTDVSPYWVGQFPGRYQIFSNALRIAPGMGAGAYPAIFATGTVGTNTQRVTSVRKGNQTTGGYYIYLGVDGQGNGGYSVLFAGDAVVLRRNGALIEVKYYNTLTTPPDMTQDTTFVAELVGNVITIKINGQSFITYTDSSPYINGYGGLMINDETVLMESLQIERF